jgi:hypothetical protein
MEDELQLTLIAITSAMRTANMGNQIDRYNYLSDELNSTKFNFKRPLRMKDLDTRT